MTAKFPDTPLRSEPFTDDYDPASKPDDDIPDLSTPYWVEQFAKATVQRGRPKELAPKVSTTIRLDPDVLAAFKAEGPGWQSRINEALRRAAGL
ncbi:hypothetical protein HYN69_07890 [Gemmobacter aquarius]|uniref:BrnA antitoxin of type II toxin-antitoxin system n=1 Tax=Paragemmobacter aquarius TaxID=2169400 RepID=A0A2S0UKX4_9RHOB|nr:BrnA antitoxin family protein [Gemmobacter aquarius]AWB48445.1 hypothetical protein HYN69_07890 [Gemmobacter aquarius]